MYTSLTFVQSDIVRENFFLDNGVPHHELLDMTHHVIIDSPNSGKMKF